MNKFETLYNQILNEQKRIKIIMVKDINGKTVNIYAPNHIGSTEQRLKSQAEKEAKELNGKVVISYYK
jgi:hypothetical protein